MMKMTNKNFRIAFSGKARSGKDSAAAALFQKYQFKTIKFADPLYKLQYHIQDLVEQQHHKDTKLLQFLGEGLRQNVDKDIWVINAKNTIKQCEDNIVITDLRYKNEYDMLKKDFGFFICRIERKNRPIDRDVNHISEVDLDDVEFDAVIHNDGTLDEFNKKIINMLEQNF